MAERTGTRPPRGRRAIPVLVVLLVAMACGTGADQTTITGPAGIDDGTADAPIPELAGPPPTEPPPLGPDGEGSNDELRSSLELFDAVISASDLPPEVTAAWDGVRADAAAWLNPAGEGAVVDGRARARALVGSIDGFQSVIDEAELEPGIVEQWEILRADLERSLGEEL